MDQAFETFYYHLIYELENLEFEIARNVGITHWQSNVNFGHGIMVRLLNIPPWQ